MSSRDSLNQRALQLVDHVLQHQDELRVRAVDLPLGAHGLDFGAEVPGTLAAGRWLAMICGADLLYVSTRKGEIAGKEFPIVRVHSYEPVKACMAAQYAGWEIKVDDFFAIGSGPMRAIFAEEEIFDHIHYSEKSQVAVGVLETRCSPTRAVVDYLCEKLKVTAENLWLLYAPTASIAGSCQVVARSVETALHKLHELGFDINQVYEGHGSAPLPKVAGDDLAAIGVTNDAILYGAEVTLTVDANDLDVIAYGPKTPSSASSDYGEPFIEIFKKYDHDFYKIDKLLFSPARITFKNHRTHNEFTYGEMNTEVLERSFSQA